ncbi:MAG: hypothetical protein KC877_01040 [Candidatus Kaiserbacteria bacterium]|nr:hypothetical protein [Candidatus Kaiserbacteria bacterium]MCB9816488.1 hypothetical protein [Candidatus Nomurabacteria bacterium]
MITKDPIDHIHHVQPWKQLHLMPTLYYELLAMPGVEKGMWVEEMVEPIREPKDVILYKCTIAQLGFAEGVEYAVACREVIKAGFALCPESLGPILRVDYKDQPKGEEMVIAMRGASCLTMNRVSEDPYWLYYVLQNKDGQLWIGGNFNQVNHNSLGPETVIVFTI